MLVQMIGYLSSVLVFVAFFMRTMVPLRYVANASNNTFIVWSQALNIWPVLVLHTALLPLNVIRLVQIRRMLSRIETARGTGLDLSVLAVGLRAERHVAGTVLFERGDKGDAAFWWRKVRWRLPSFTRTYARASSSVRWRCSRLMDFELPPPSAQLMSNCIG
jgi:CRP/FNR family cyclic AMP-dependent transcriptional regulator